MKHTLRYTAFAIVCLIIFSSTFVHIIPVAHAEPIPPNGTLSEKVLSLIFKLIGWFNIGSGYAPKYFFAEPSVVEIGYLENVTVNVTFGNYRREASGYQAKIFDEVTLVYDVEFPPGIQEDAWSVIFDPPVFDLREKHRFIKQ